MQSCLINNLFTDFLSFKNLFFKLTLSFDLQETNIVNITHTIHDFLQPSFILGWYLIKVRILMWSWIILINYPQVVSKIGSLTELGFASREVISRDMLFDLSFIVLVHCFFFFDSGVVLFHFSFLEFSFLLIHEIIHYCIIDCGRFLASHKDIRLSKNLFS
jgi:hypothetical protein